MGFGSSKSSSQQQSQQTSESRNQSYPFIQSAFGGQTALTGQASNAISDLLGLNGPSQQNAGFDNFRNSSGYNFIQNEGIRGINANDASKGLLGSGAALKSLATYNTGLASQYLDKYLSNLFNLSDTGIKAGQLITSAGNTANSQGTSSGVSTGKSSSFSL